MPRNISCKDQHNKGKKWQGPSRSSRCFSETLRKGGKNSQKTYTDLHDPDNHDDMITHLEPDSLEC